MKIFGGGLFLLLGLVGLAWATPVEPQQLYYAPLYGYNQQAAAIDVANVQHHAQDGYGQYNYGYANPTSSKSEVKSADGVVRGSYSYVDANNIVQTVHYISDALGFRVQATNLPQAPVLQAPPQEIALAFRTEMNLAPVEQQEQQSYYLPVYAPTYQYHVPAPVAPTTIPDPIPEVNSLDIRVGGSVGQGHNGEEQVVVAALPAQVFTKYHSQDELGGYYFGYQDGHSQRDESRDANGAVTGSYTYVDQQGQPQVVNYVADHLGFRVQGTTIQGDYGVAPLPVVDTPEVAAAKAAHLKLVEEIKESLPSENEQISYEAIEKEKEAAASFVVEPAQIANEAAAVPAFYAQPVVAPIAVEPSIYHAQDGYGQYNYGYVTADSSKSEQRTPEGHVLGTYNYVDADGLLQTVSYVSDELGFRVAATNLPQQQQAPEQYHQPIMPEENEAKEVLQQIPFHQHAAVSVPAVAAIPVHATQFHAQDEFGQYNYGYANANSAKHEFKDANGIVQGSYSYVDANGHLQVTNYISDAEGFKLVSPAVLVPEAKQVIDFNVAEEEEQVPQVPQVVEEQPLLDIRFGTQ